MAKRFSLALPDDLMAEVQRVAAERETAVNEVLKQFARIGLLVAAIEKDPNRKLVIREGKKETIVLLI